MRRRPLPVSRLPDWGLGGPGLGAEEVEARRRVYAANDVLERTVRPWWAVLRDTATDPMLWFLAVTAALYAAMGDRLEALTLLVALVPLVGMDVALHWRVTASTQGLASRLATGARVVRDGVTRTVPAAAVVPGDLMLVFAGEYFPADGVIVAGAELQAEESALTGEAYPVRKHPLAGVPPGDEPPVAGEYWGLAGTRLLTGEATVRVVFTGGDTLYGEIVRSSGGDRAARTPLQAAIANLVGVLTVAAVGLCATLAVVRLVQGHGWLDAVASAVTLAVAALPEEFPVVFAVFLGVGVHRLARHQALVRRAVTVENIGRVTCICSDKTGTITEGRVRLTHVEPVAGMTDAEVLELAILASRPAAGDAIDVALAEAAGPPLAVEMLGVFPFTEDRRRETAVLRHPVHGGCAVTKGAAEEVLALTDAGPARGVVEGRVGVLSTEGHKVLACAWRPLDVTAWAGGEPDRGYRLAGLLAFEDPVRPGVAEAVRHCRDAGIRTVMVTGDHPSTAAAVAREIGLGDPDPRVVAGDAVRAGAAGLAGVDVVARATPAEKLALVRALQAAGEVVVVTGDGVNDVPALQAADIGVAMGERGVRSAREAAAIVLLDDDFGTIVRAVAEGRQLFTNLRRSFLYLIALHIPLVATATLVPLAGFPLLYLPIHVVWLELIIHPTAMLAFQDVVDPGLAHRRPPARFVSRRDWIALGTTGALLTAALLAAWLRGRGAGHDDAHARAVAVAGLATASAALTAVLTRLATRPARVLAAGTLAASAMLLQTPALARLLAVSPLHLDDWTLTAAMSAVAVLPLAWQARPRRA